MTSFAAYNTTPKSFDYDSPAQNNIQAKEEESPPPAPIVEEPPKITIQEIIPAIKEIPMTEPPKPKEKEEMKPNDSDIELKLSDTVTEIKEENDVVTFDVESDSSEISEIYHHPPPVLRIGDKLLFLKKGELIAEKDTSTPASVITIIGAEGLQRGFEDSAENAENIENGTKQLSTTTVENLNVVPLQVTTTMELITEMESSTTTTLEPITSSIPQEILITTTEVYGTTEEIENRTESLENDTLVNTEENLTTEGSMVEISPVPLEDIKEDQVIEDENPAYPPIPEIMVPQDQPEQDEETIVMPNVTDSKILPDVLEIRNNHSIPANATHPEWLKNESFANTDNLMNLRAALPEHILQERVDSSTTEEETPTTTTIITIVEQPQKQVVLLADEPKSDESKERIQTSSESGESTTKKNSHASLMSNENASIDIVDNESPEDPEMDETDNKSEVKSVELNDGKVNENVSPKMAGDVEMFDPTTIRRTDDVETIAPSPEKIVEKRENSMDSQIFQELDEQLKVDGKEPAEEIFKELLQETKNTTPKSKTTENHDSEALQRVSEALQRFQLRDTKHSLDSSILGILRDFFTSQYRSYDGRK